MPIRATKNGITRDFKEDQWNRMPKDKFGWSEISKTGLPPNSIPIPAELIQKKMVAGATAENAKPIEIVKITPEVPAELLVPNKPEDRKIVSKPKKEKK